MPVIQKGLIGHGKNYVLGEHSILAVYCVHAIRVRPYPRQQASIARYDCAYSGIALRVRVHLYLAFDQVGIDMKAQDIDGNNSS